MNSIGITGPVTIVGTVGISGSVPQAPYTQVAFATLTITASVAVALRAVPANNLVGRRAIMIAPSVAGYTYGFSPTSVPFDLPNNEVQLLFVGPEITLYAKKGTGTGTVNVAEFS